jgi:lipoprotein-anchoring transpeptidase ErfK/SrfK
VHTIDWSRSARVFVPFVMLLVAGCGSGGLDASIGEYPDKIYDQVVDGSFVVPAADTGVNGLNPQFARREVSTPSSIPTEPTGTIVVDTPNRYLYLVQANGKSIRYGIGVGREGFAWAGEATIKAKQAWPTWTPPPEMLARDPDSRPYANGMPGGVDNPLGARAMYLFQGDRDTLYRIHGTTEAWSIGQAVSSGCVRMLDQDVIDLYNRVPLGTKVVVVGDPSLSRGAATASGSPPRGETLFPPVAPKTTPVAAPAAAPVPPQNVGPA